MYYKFSKPIQEGKMHGQPFYVVEISEHHNGLVLSRSKISLEAAKEILRGVVSMPYHER